MTQAAVTGEQWKFFSTVALALIAGTIGSDKMKSNKQTSLIIIMCFLFVATGNLLALVEVQNVVIELGEIANQIALTEPQLAMVRLNPTPILQLILFHVVCDICVVYAIYFISRGSWVVNEPNKEINKDTVVPPF